MTFFYYLHFHITSGGDAPSGKTADCLRRFSHPLFPKVFFSALMQSYTKRLSSLQIKNNRLKTLELEQPQA